jgi:hypothetical protein
MTIYTIDWSKPESISRLLSTQLIAGLCSNICAKLLNSLADILMTSNQQDKHTVLKCVTVIRWYINQLAGLPPYRKGVPQLTNIIHIYIERYMKERDIFCNEVVTMDTITSIPPVIIIELISEIIENTLISLKPVTIPIEIYVEMIEKLEGIINRLLKIFPYHATIPQDNLAFAIIKLEVVDQVTAIEYHV